jgi:hypothetical protein
MDVHLLGMHLKGVHPIGVYLTGVHLMSVHLIDVYFMDVDMIFQIQKGFGETFRSPTLQTVMPWSICRDLSCKIRVFVLVAGVKTSAWPDVQFNYVP